MSGELRRLDPDEEVGIYACGPTVYSRIHIGNARPFVVFTLLTRFLRSEGYRARLAINVTDINDQIYTSAEPAGTNSAALASLMPEAHFEATGRDLDFRERFDTDPRRSLDMTAARSAPHHDRTLLLLLGNCPPGVPTHAREHRSTTRTTTKEQRMPPMTRTPPEQWVTQSNSSPDIGFIAIDLL